MVPAGGSLIMPTANDTANTPTSGKSDVRLFNESDDALRIIEGDAWQDSAAVPVTWSAVDGAVGYRVAAGVVAASLQIEGFDGWRGCTVKAGELAYMEKCWLAFPGALTGEALLMPRRRAAFDRHRDREEYRMLSAGQTMPVLGSTLLRLLALRYIEVAAARRIPPDRDRPRRRRGFRGAGRATRGVSRLRPRRRPGLGRAVH